MQLLKNQNQGRFPKMSTLQNGKFRFAVIGEAEGNEREIFELLHFATTELNLTCEFINLNKLHVLISKSEDEI